jgi:IclR family KDG regulon transcriptional repressor
MEYTQSLGQGLDILLLYDIHTSALTAAEISKKKGYSLSKTYRIIRTLMKYGFIEEEKGTARYSLGPNVLHLGLLAQRKFSLAAIAKPFMKELSVLSKESVVLTAVNGTKAVCLENVESEEPIRSSTFQAGEIVFLHAGASSKILMAHLPENEWDRIIKKEGLRQLTPNTVSHAEKLKEQLREIRRRGYAVSDREVYEDVRAVGAPILDGMGNLVAGLSIVGPVYRINKKKLSSLVKLAVEYAGKISNRIGYAYLEQEGGPKGYKQKDEGISLKKDLKKPIKTERELRRSSEKSPR